MLFCQRSVDTWGGPRVWVGHQSISDWEPGFEGAILDIGVTGTSLKPGTMGVGIEVGATGRAWCWSESKASLHSSWPGPWPREKPGFVGAHLKCRFAGADWEPGAPGAAWGHGSQLALGYIRDWSGFGGACKESPGLQELA